MPAGSMPIRPRPPARLTARASFEPAKPPMAALTISGFCTHGNEACRLDMLRRLKLLRVVI